MTARELIDALRKRGIVRAEVAGFEADDRPWFLSLIQGAAGWLAGVFLLVFVGILLEPDSTASIVTCGVVLLASAWGLYRLRKAVFLEQFALALSIAGQIALAWAIIKDSRSGAFVAGMLFLLQCALFALMPNRIARTLSALFASCAWIYLIRFWLRPGSTSDLFFGNDGLNHAPLFGLASVPIGWIATWAPLVLATGWLVRREAAWMARGAAKFARPAFAGMLLGLSFGGVVTEPLSPFVLGIQEMGLPFNLWSVFPLLSIGLAVYAAYLAFRVQSYGLMGVAILGALVHLSRFYYLYGTTLLQKSVLMLLIGAALLGIAMALRRGREAA